MKSTIKIYWIFYTIFALIGLVLAPSLCDFIFRAYRYHIDKPYYLIGSIVTTSILLFTKIDKIERFKLIIFCILGFFSFSSIFIIGIILTIISRLI